MITPSDIAIVLGVKIIDAYTTGNELHCEAWFKNQNDRDAFFDLCEEATGIRPVSRWWRGQYFGMWTEELVDALLARVRGE